METQAPERTEGADAEQVLCGEEGGRRRASREKIHRCRLSLLNPSEVDPDQNGIIGEVLGLEFLPVALVAERGRHDALKVDQAGDPLMAVRREVLHAPSSTTQVVGENRV